MKMPLARQKTSILQPIMLIVFSVVCGIGFLYSVKRIKKLPDWY